MPLMVGLGAGVVVMVLLWWLRLHRSRDDTWATVAAFERARTAMQPGPAIGSVAASRVTASGGDREQSTTSDVGSRSRP